MVDILTSVSTALRKNIRGLESAHQEFSDAASAQAIGLAVELISKMSGRLIVSGMGKSGHIARKLAATFASTGTPAYFVHPAEASHGDLGMIRHDDVLLLLSWSGESRELSDVLTYAVRFKVPVIALTGSATGSLAKRATIAIVSPPVEEACPHNLAPTTSTLVQLAIGDAMAVTLLALKGFSEASFRDFHPGGKLGSALTPISEIMLVGDDLPLIAKDRNILETIGEISRKGRGIVGLTDTDDSLVGIITDGDIRRYLEAHSSGSMKEVMHENKASSLMTQEFISLEAERLAARALSILQERRISAAFVVQDGRAIGLVTMLQLLEKGVA